MTGTYIPSTPFELGCLLSRIGNLHPDRRHGEIRRHPQHKALIRAFLCLHPERRWQFLRDLDQMVV